MPFGHATIAPALAGLGMTTTTRADSRLARPAIAPSRDRIRPPCFRLPSHRIGDSLPRDDICGREPPCPIWTPTGRRLDAGTPATLIRGIRTHTRAGA